MRFSLLTPPEDAPSRIPLSRGLPSASAAAVETGYLPRALPLPAMDADAVAAPYEALARFAATGTKVSSDVATLIVAAEAKKREANDAAEIESLYTEHTVNVDEDFERLKVSETDQTLRPAFNQMWNKRTLESMKMASNANVRAGLQTKLSTLLRTKSGEVADTTRTKLVNRHQAQLEQDVTRLSTLATDPKLTLPQQRLHEEDLESRLLKAANSGLHPHDYVSKLREKSIYKVKTERAYTWAHDHPLAVQDRLDAGDTFDLDAHGQRQLREYTDNRVRTLRSDAVFLRSEDDRKTKEQQDALAMDERANIVTNFKTGGAGLDMVDRINGMKRALGETNHAQLLALHEAYQQRYLRPEKARPSDGAIYTKLRVDILTNRTPVTQHTLAGYFAANTRGEPGLDEGDYDKLSNLQLQMEKDRKAERERPKTEAEKQREDDIKQAKGTIESFLQRGNRYQGDETAVKTGMLADDAVNEFLTRVRADTSLDPLLVAGEMIGHRMARMDTLLKSLPYKSDEDVRQAYERGQLGKRTAEFYYSIFRILKKTEKPAGPTESEPPPPSSGGGGLLEPIWRWWQGPPGNPTGPPPQPGIRPPKKG